MNALRTQTTRYPVVVSWQYSFDSGSPDEAQIAFLRDMMGTFAENREGLAYASYTVESIASNREDFQAPTEASSSLQFCSASCSSRPLF